MWMLGCDPWASTPEADRGRSSYAVECWPSFERTMTPADIFCSRTFPRTTAKWTLERLVVVAQETVWISPRWSVLKYHKVSQSQLFENKCEET